MRRAAAVLGVGTDNVIAVRTDQRSDLRRISTALDYFPRWLISVCRYLPSHFFAGYNPICNFTQQISPQLNLLPTYPDDPPSERQAVAISSCRGPIGSSETEHSASQLLERGIDCHPTSDSCVRRRHSGAISKHFYSLFLIELP